MKHAQLTAFALAAAMLPATAQAQDMLSGVFACADITDSAERLACFDASVATLRQADEIGDLVAVSRSEIAEVERDSFGFNLPSIPKLGSLFGRGKSDARKESDLTAPVETAEASSTVPARTVQPTGPIKEITQTLERTTKINTGKMRFYLTNGQVWDQIDAETVRLPKARNGEAIEVHIRKAALGSFMLKIEDRGKSIRVKRRR